MSAEQASEPLQQGIVSRASVAQILLAPDKFPGQLIVGCGGETLLGVSRVKVEGRREVSALEFATGARLQPQEGFALGNISRSPNISPSANISPSDNFD